MSVRKRHWTNTEGVLLSAWVCDYRDLDGIRRQKTFRLKKQADLYQTKIKADRFDAYLKANDPAATAIANRVEVQPTQAKDKQMNKQVDNTVPVGAPEPEKRPVTLQLLDMYDHTSIAVDLATALEMATSDILDTRQRHAMAALCDVLLGRIEDLKGMIEEARSAAV